MKIYQIDSSARKEGSTSRALAKKLLDKIKNPNDEIIYRDLNDEMVFVSGLTESGMNIDKKDQTDHHKKMFEFEANAGRCGIVILLGGPSISISPIFLFLDKTEGVL